MTPRQMIIERFIECGAITREEAKTIPSVTTARKACRATSNSLADDAQTLLDETRGNKPSERMDGLHEASRLLVAAETPLGMFNLMSRSTLSWETQHPIRSNLQRGGYTYFVDRLIKLRRGTDEFFKDINGENMPLAFSSIARHLPERMRRPFVRQASTAEAA